MIPTLLTLAGLSFVAVVSVLTVWWRREQHLRAEFHHALREEVLTRLDSRENSRLRFGVNPIKNDQRMAEFASIPKMRKAA